MAKLTSFEEISSWKKSREFIKEFNNIVVKNEQFLKHFYLKDQMFRSLISVPSNIAEGFERETVKEFIRFLYIAKGSAGEFRSQLYIAFDLNYITENEFFFLQERINEISKMLSGFIKYLKTL